MKKSTKIVIAIIGILAIIAIVIAVIMIKPKDNNSNQQDNNSKLGKIDSTEDLEQLVEKIYEGNDNLPRLMTQTVDVNDSMSVEMFTGIINGDDLEFLVVSEPLMSAQAYSLVLAKVKKGVDANKIAETMSEQVDMRKWICVSAEKLYATNSGDIVCLVMSSEEWATPVFDKFKELAGNYGKEYEKTEKVENMDNEGYMDNDEYMDYDIDIPTNIDEILNTEELENIIEGIYEGASNLNE